jgi:hypothetical protein
MRFLNMSLPSAARRIATLISLVLAVEAGCRAQTEDASLPPPNTSVQVHRLTILSSDLPEATRKQIVAVYQGRGFPPQELAERIRQTLRDAGYFHAVVEDPLLTTAGSIDSAWTADMTFRVVAGAQYRLAEIRFIGVSAFPLALLNEQFSIEPGSLFSASAIGRGLKRVKNLYAEKGYVNFGAIPTPQVDEANHTIVLTIDADEGKPADFGSLILNGQEPRAGDGKRLLDAWTAEVEGRPYSPTLFKHWLSTYAPWSSKAPEGMSYTKTLPGPDLQRINILLEFP